MNDIIKNVKNINNIDINPLVICHRINTIEQLQKIPEQYGIEIDLRDSNNKIIVTHDPFTTGPEFKDYIKHYKHAFIILNIKSEGIEWEIIKLLKEYNIKNYFFLDCSFPMIYKLYKYYKENRDNKDANFVRIILPVAIRYSEYESLDTIKLLLNEFKMGFYVWIDCFNKIPDIKEIKNIKQIKTCLVSSELQGRFNEHESYKQFAITNNIDMICTKYMD
jgi:hypothetical protein